MNNGNIGNGQMPPVQAPQMGAMPGVQMGAMGQAPIMSQAPTIPQAPMINGGQQYYTAEQVTKLMAPKKDVAGLVKTIVIIVLALISMAFIGLFIWMYLQYDEASTDLDSQIKAAVLEAVDEQKMTDEAEFLEREKEPNTTFSGPADYGELTFNYPKTWSVYVEKDASNGGDFKAYFNPVQVNVVAKSTINALRVTIREDSFEKVVEEYQKAMNKKDSNLTVETITVNGVVGNIYTGTIPDTELSGYIVVFKIRDKAVIMQTDSVLFKSDFDKVIKSVTFNS